MTPRLLENLRQERLHTHRPFKGSIELTYRCNERCSHCYLDTFTDDQSRLLTLDQWKVVLRKLKKAGVLYLDLIGGEPMVSPIFWDVLKEASDLGFFVGIISNGLKINTQTAKKLKSYGLSSCTLSLYALNPDIHDKMTSVPGSHKKIMAAIEALRDAHLPITLNCLLTKDNIEHYFKLEDWCRKENLKLLPDPNVTPKTDGDTAPLEKRASPEQLKWYYQQKFKRDNVKALAPGLNKEEFVCGAGKLKCAVDRYGQLLTCLEIRDSLGSLVEEDFDKLWFESEKAKKWRSLKNRDLKNLNATGGCDHCPGAARQESGDALTITDNSLQIQRAQNDALASIGG